MRENLLSTRALTRLPQKSPGRSPSSPHALTLQRGIKHVGQDCCESLTASFRLKSSKKKTVTGTKVSQIRHSSAIPQIAVASQRMVNAAATSFHAPPLRQAAT